ncbi:hypothetical protein [Pseudorhodoferax sp. Leaf265]|uniref:hypothetical protein n=1 Tax=Pseudorhodoferax sp. Leaf265 TaxID=1736315 RepID=UPI0012E6F642|nr:hypothetical protein [Pseudorhodoferax sp. Leaf265]
MNRIPIDFGPSAGRPSRRIAWIVVAGAVAGMAGLAPRWMQAWSQLNAATDEHAIALSNRDGRALGAEPQELPLHVAAEQAVARLRMPWARMLVAVESAGGKDVTLLSLEPNATTGEVRIQAQAKDMPALIRYVRTVGAAPDFSAVQLESHQVQLQHAQQPIDGSIVARWTPQPSPPGPAASAAGSP